MMISTTLVASFLLPCHASFAAANTLPHAAQDPDSLQPNPAAPLTGLVGRAASATPGRLARFPILSTWRRLDEDLKLCDAFVRYTTHVITTQAEGATSVEAADLDGDGDLDILSASTDDGKIAWYENLDGAGNFSGPQRVITIQAHSESFLQGDTASNLGILLVDLVAAADFDGDGDLDVLSASDLGGTVTWNENLDGAGDFSGPDRIITTHASVARAVAVADLDGDADLDVLSASYSNWITWYENVDGAGTFSGPERVITTQEVGTWSVAAADLDGDGDLDVLSASSGSIYFRSPSSDDKIAWYENLNGAGDFSGSQRVVTTEVYGARSVAAADLDGDGDLDVLSASEYDEKIVWYENVDGDGNFSEPQRVITMNLARIIKSVAAADLDGDADLDVLSASWDDNKIAWYENVDGAGDFSEPQRVITTLAGGAKSVAAADLDGDSDLDVLSASSDDNKIAWYENLAGAGDFSGLQRVITTRALSATSVAAADLDGDSDLDVLSASFRDNKIAWYENLHAAGNFTGPQRVITIQAYGASSVAASDLDGDADLDVLSASERDSKIAWYENLDGAGDFSGPQRVITVWANGAVAVAAADLDGDADLDVLSASEQENKIAWYENLDGAGNFTGPQRVITIQAYGASSVAAADLDGDTDVDVLSASYGDDKIAWYENLDSAGDFSGPQRIITIRVDGARSVAAADVDGDGNLDVLLASGSKIAWYENMNGAGDFSGPQRVIITHQAKSPASVAAADVDGDGDLDVLSGSLLDGKIAWYENVDGAGDFLGPQHVITTQAEGAWSVAAADLDGDADLDVLSASSYDNKIAWYENECRPTTAHPTPDPQRTPYPTSCPTPQPTTSQPTPQPTCQPTPEPSPEPTYWGAQVFGNQPQTAGFERLCVAWCVIFGVISLLVLGYVVHTSLHKDKDLARIILTIVISQYDYGSDTLFIGFQNFVTPILFVAAIITYLLPLAVFIIVYRRVIGMHVAHIYTSTKAKTIVRFDSWDDLPMAFTEIASFALFPFAIAASIVLYLMLLFAFISCKLMSVSYLAVKFFEAGGFECTPEVFEVMFKRNIVIELICESSGELIVILVDTLLRAQQDFRSNTGLSSWAMLSMVGSILMLVMEAWPYAYYIIWMGLDLNASIAAVPINPKFTREKVPGTWLVDRLVRLAGLVPPRGQTVRDKSVNEKSSCDSEVHDVKNFELIAQ